MIKNPIQKVTNKLQYRAIGIVSGIYNPNSKEQLNKGTLIDSKGKQIETVVLGKALPLIKKSPLIRNVIVFTVFITFYTLAIVGYIHNYKNTNREYNVPDDLIERINEIEKNNHKHNTTDYLIERINGIEENNHKHNTTDHHDTTINDPQIVYEPSHTSVMGHEWIGRGMRLDYGDWRLNVVTPTYTQGKTYQYNDVTYSVPDHMQCQTIPESGEQSMTVRISNLVEYQIQKAAEFGIDAYA